MTDTNPFFRFVWRANALMLFGLACLAFLAALYLFLPWSARSRVAYGAPAGGMETPLPAGSRDPAAPPQEVLHVGTFSRADGPVFHAPVYSGRPGDRYKSLSSVKGAGGRVHNVMIFNAETGAVARLFPDDKGRIVDEEVVSRSRDDWPRSRVLARLFVYVPADGNGDGRIDDQDPQRVVITRPDGSQPTVVVDGVERYAAATPTEATATTLSYFVRRGGELTYGEFDLETFKPGRTSPVTVPRT